MTPTLGDDWRQGRFPEGLIDHYDGEMGGLGGRVAHTLPVKHCRPISRLYYTGQSKDYLISNSLADPSPMCPTTPRQHPDNAPTTPRQRPDNT